MLFETEYINNTHDQEAVISFFSFFFVPYDSSIDSCALHPVLNIINPLLFFVYYENIGCAAFGNNDEIFHRTRLHIGDFGISYAPLLAGKVDGMGLENQTVGMKGQPSSVSNEADEVIGGSAGEFGFIVGIRIFGGSRFSYGTVFLSFQNRTRAMAVNQPSKMDRPTRRRWSVCGK